MAALRVFVSYRRDDGPLACLLARHLDGALNTETRQRVDVFRDVEQRGGEKWPERVRAELAAADVVLVVIGQGWLSAKDSFQRRRIDQTDDWVRIEIELALNEEKVLIPVVFEEPRRLLPPYRHQLPAWRSSRQSRYERRRLMPT